MLQYGGVRIGDLLQCRIYAASAGIAAAAATIAGTAGISLLRSQSRAAR